jgi:Coenzyme PQQ synthesis protein D (PqqD)
MLVANNAHISAEVFETEVVVIHFLKGTYFSLRGASMALWAWLRPGADEATLAELLAARYGLSAEQCRAEAAKVVEILKKFDLVIESEQPAPSRDAYVMSAGPARFEEPMVEAFEDLQELISIDPVHEVDPNQGWPHRPASTRLD